MEELELGMEELSWPSAGPYQPSAGQYRPSADPYQPHDLPHIKLHHHTYFQLYTLKTVGMEELELGMEELSRPSPGPY